MHPPVSWDDTVLLVILVLMVLLAATYLTQGRRERLAVERGLYGEVIALRWQAAAVAAEITRRHRTGEPFDAAFFALWPLSEPLIYPSTGAAALGRLSREASGRVGYFHAQLAGARARMARAEDIGGFEPSPYRTLSGLVRAYHDIDPWVRGLQHRLGSMADEMPDLSDADALVGQLEEASKEPIAVAYCRFDCAHP